MAYSTDATGGVPAGFEEVSARFIPPPPPPKPPSPTTIDPERLGFDADFYRAAHADLGDLDDAAALEHYIAFGAAEGRRGSELGAEAEFLDMMNAQDSVLEIGPFCNPKMKGENAAFFDVYDQAELRRRAEGFGQDPDRVPHIDFVSEEADLSIVDRKFAAAFSAHAIEHQPSLVKHLNDVSALLEKGGIYGLISPDHRYCFDHFQNPTSLCDVLAAHQAERRLHTMESVGRYFVNTTHNSPSRHWAGDHGVRGEHTGMTRHQADRHAAEHVLSQPGAYIDTHAWYLTPDNFEFICRELRERDLIDLRVETVYPTLRDHFQFFAVLRKD